MAQKVITQLVDDLDGTEIKDGKGETVAFSLDGRDYTIDLTNKNADKFRGVFQDYIAVASKVAGGRRGRRSAAAADSGPKPADVRSWAKDNGYSVPDRGRIPAEVKDAYDAAH